MALMVWDEKLMLGIPSIDAQHHRLVTLINQLHDAMMARQGHDALGRILDELLSYTAEHFAYEEKLLAKHGYRHLGDHLELHSELTHQVHEFREQFFSGRIGMSAAVLEFLTQWLSSHICTEDDKYVRLLMAKGVR